MAKPSKQLTAKEQGLIDELDQYIAYAPHILTLYLSPSQTQTWQRICFKKKEHPRINASLQVNTYTQTYRDRSIQEVVAA